MIFFIAIPLPDDTITRLSTLRGSLQLNWNDPATYHLPLCFIEDLHDISIMNDIDIAFSHLHFNSFELTINGVLFTETKEKDFILSANIAKTEVLLHLKKKIERILLQHHLSIIKKHFNPQIRLAKTNYINPQQIENWLQTYNLFKLVNIHITQFALCSYHPKKNDSYYITETLYELR